MTDGLKDCPFCGGEAESDLMQPFRHYRTGEPLSQTSVYCTVCSAQITHYPDDVDMSRDETMEFAITAWNTRADAALVEALERIERLEAERRCIVSHATMGHTTGDGMSLNDISVEISRQRNKLYQAGKEAAQPKDTPNDQ